jgi:hypothetical protein
MTRVMTTVQPHLVDLIMQNSHLSQLIGKMEVKNSAVECL